MDRLFQSYPWRKITNILRSSTRFCNYFSDRRLGFSSWFKSWQTQSMPCKDAIQAWRIALWKPLLTISLDCPKHGTWRLRSAKEKVRFVYSSNNIVELHGAEDIKSDHLCLLRAERWAVGSSFLNEKAIINDGRMDSCRRVIRSKVRRSSKKRDCVHALRSWSQSSA